MQTQETATRLLHLFHKQASSSQLSKPVASKAVQRTLLLANESFATPLILLCLDKYGMDLLEWAPETIRMELEADFQLKLPAASLDKIMAAVTILTTNYFYKDVTRFIDLCNILAGDTFQPDTFDPADLSEMLLGITEAMLLWPPNDDKEDTEFSAEIREYISQVLGLEGILKPFDVLQLAFSGDQAAKVDAAYSDDPEMYSAIYKTQQSKTGELRSVYLENMSDLAMQLELLPLQHGTTEGVAQQLRQLIQRANPASSEE